VAQNEQTIVEELPSDAELQDVPVEEVDELIGRSIGSYVITKPLGKGGMGAVYAAEHPVIGSRVAIKFLHQQYSNDKSIVERFFNEARAVNVIGHDNILKIIDLNVTEDNRHYFIMEFLIGKALQKLVEAGLPVPLSETGPIMLQFCEALAAAHANKIYHRDVKPDNVYLIVHKGRKNFVKVVDFGIAKLTGDDGNSTAQTQAGMVMGTPAYMSPEQAGGMGNKIDGRSDIYSTGCMMFQMATGKLPFPGTSFGEVLIGHLQLPPPNPRDLCPDIPEDYEAVILKTLAKKQEDRQQTMKELAAEIKACMDRAGISAELPIATEADMPKASAPTKGLAKTMAANKTQAAMKAQQSRPGQSQPQITPPQQATFIQAAPIEPPKSNMGLVVAVVALVLIIVGGVAGFAIHQGNKREEAEVAAAAERAANERVEATRKAAEEERARQVAAQAAQPITLIAVSEPLGASVTGNWTENDKPQDMVGNTPYTFKVPRGSKVRFVFSRQGFQSFTQDVIADSEKTVSAKLEADKGSAPPSSPGGKKTVKKAPAGGDDNIPIDF
jgi:serine/threonine protein kinase/uncharacterized membrane protein